MTSNRLMKKKFRKNLQMIFGIEIGLTFLGHRPDSAFDCVMNFSKLGDSHHAQNLLVMARHTGDSDFLVVLLCLGQDLDQHRNSPTVDVSIGIDFQQDIAGALIVGILVGFGQKWL